jgi:hypothetical protein
MMEKRMKNLLTKWFMMPCLALVMLAATGCSSVFKGLLIDQLVGFATAITSAGATSLIQMLLGGTAE